MMPHARLARCCRRRRLHSERGLYYAMTSRQVRPMSLWTGESSLDEERVSSGPAGPAKPCIGPQDDVARRSRQEQPMWTLPHDDTYIVDSNLVMFYMTGRFPTWVKFIRDHDALGKKLYALPQIERDLQYDLPDVIETLRVADPSAAPSPDDLDVVCNEIVEKLQFSQTFARECRSHVEQIIAAGFFVNAADPLQIPPDQGRRAVFATSDRFIRRVMVRTRLRTRIIGQILETFRLRLIPIRYIANDTWTDLV